MVAYVLNCEGNPIMPCPPSKARKLLVAGKAVVVKRVPFTIKLKFPCANRVQEVVAGMDTGIKVIGTAAVANGKSLYQSEVLLRSEEIKSKMEQRSSFRKNRRSRKTGYRQPRFLNRGSSIKDGRLPPSVKHIVDAHFREKRFIESILPVSQWNIETASFDTHKITNPTVSKEHGETYQNGRCKDFYNVKAYVLSRDSHTCQKCKSGKGKLHVHHIVFRSNGGGDSPDNLVVLCVGCHDKIHALKDEKAEKVSRELQKKRVKHTRAATQISIVKARIEKNWGAYKETFGYVTKYDRESLGLEKAHHVDALVIASEGEVVKPLDSVLIRRCVSRGDYKQTFGGRSEKKIPTGKLFGFRKFDLISTVKGVGFVSGKRSSGYFAISDIFGKSISSSVNIKKSSSRIQSRKTVIMEAQFLPGINSGVSLRDVL